MEEYSDLFESVIQQKQAIKTFNKMIKCKTAPPEGLGTYQGSTMLVISTPALEGRAGERSGLW